VLRDIGRPLDEWFIRKWYKCELRLAYIIIKQNLAVVLGLIQNPAYSNIGL
jgi:hypothetical protein